MNGSAKAAANPAFDSNGPFDSQQIDSWLSIHADNTATVKLGMVELGQGSPTGLLMVAAEELNMDFTQMKMLSNDTDVTPNQGGTYGSQALQVGGKQTRAAAAAAYQALLGMASTHLGVPVGSLTVSKGVVSGGGKTVTYGELIGGKLFNVTIPASYNLAPIPSFFGGPASAGAGLAPGAPGTKSASAYTLVGKSPGPPRIDIPAKVIGTYTYVHNIRIPGMLHGRVVRPRGQGAYGDGTAPKVLSVDPSSISHIPNVKVVQQNNFVGVVAPKEYDAIQAAAQLKVTWAPMPPLPGVGNLWGQMRSQDKAGQTPVVPYSSLGNVDSRNRAARHTPCRRPTSTTTTATCRSGHRARSRTSRRAARGSSRTRRTATTPAARSCRRSAGRAEPAGQPDPRHLLRGLERLRLRARMTTAPLGGRDLLARRRAGAAAVHALGRARLGQLRARSDDGHPRRSRRERQHHGTDFTHFSIQLNGTDAGVQQLGAPAAPLGFNFIDTTNMGTQYKIPNQRVTLKSLPLLNNYFKTSFLRAPHAPQTVFAYEQMIDELAHAAKMDPVAFRLQNITSNANETAHNLPFTWDRWKNVLTAVAKLSNWQPKVATSTSQTGNIVTGRGIALGGSPARWRRSSPTSRSTRRPARSP